MVLFVHSEERDSLCKAIEVNYLISSEDCERDYKGKQSRTSYVRGGEHPNDFEKKRDKSVLWKHC